MSVPVPLEELRAQLDRRSGSVFLLTVGDSGRPHCVAARIGWDGDELEVRTGRSSTRNAEARPAVSLLAPPQPRPVPHATEGVDYQETDGYSLIVDGDATGISAAPEGGGIVRVRPTHAVFHRPAEGPNGAPAHDCLPVFDRAPGTGGAG